MKNKEIIVKERLYSFQLRWQRKLPDAFSSVPFFFFFFPRTLLETETKKRTIGLYVVTSWKSSEVGVSGEDSNPQTFEFRVPM